jgi:hypothetical protein
MWASVFRLIREASEPPPTAAAAPTPTAPATPT